jgi:hypothetical protein
MGAERWLAEMMAQLPPLGEAEFAGSRPVALREQADVEALVKLARTNIRKAWPPLARVPVHNMSLRHIGSIFGQFWGEGIVMCIVRIP